MEMNKTSGLRVNSSRGCYIMSLWKRILSMALITILLSCPAYAMTLQEAEDVVLANDPQAANAREFWMYQSSETDGMWVVYATGVDKSTMDFKGGAWFVTPEQAVSLGHTQSLKNWEFYSCEPQPPAPTEERSTANIWPALFVAQGPELMVSRTDRLNAWRLDASNHLPTAVDTGKLINIDSEYGQLIGMVEAFDYDYVFLAIEDEALLQIAATTIDESIVRQFPDGTKLLDQLSVQGYTLTDFLYRAAVPGSVEGLNDLPNAAGIISVNLEKDGQTWHTYLYYSEPGKALNYIDGSDWGGDGELWIATFEGKASDRLDVGLETIETRIQ